MRMTGWGAITALTIAALAALPAQAEETLETGELLISGGIEPIPTKEVAASYTIITSEEIEKFQYRNLTDALKSVPGLHVVESGARGSLTPVFTRGANSNQTLVLVNGMPINDPSSPGGAANLAGVPLDNVARIEVVRGPQSALYGSQAIGGVVNIITKTGGGEPRSTLRVEGGTLGTLNTYASTGGSFGKTNYFLSLAREATEGNDITPARLRDARGSEDDEAETISTSGRIGTQIDEHVSGSLFLEYTKSDVDTDEDGSTAGFVPVYQNMDSNYEMSRLFMSGDLTGRFMDGRWRPRLSLGYTRQVTQSADKPDPGGAVYLSDVTYEGETIKIALDNTFDLSREHMLSFGGSVTRDKYKSSGFRDLGGFIISPSSDDTTKAFAVYAGDHMTFGDRLFATVNVRYDAPDDVDNRFTYTIAPGYYHPETDTRLTFSYGTAFKAPSLYQLYGFEPDSFGGFYIGNPNLKPEKSKGWEVGIEQGFLSRKLLTGATWFDTEVEDAIAVFTDPITFNSTSLNVNKFDTKGLEAFIEVKPADNLTARIDYTWTLLKADTGGTVVGAFTRRPRHQIGFTGSWEPVGGTVFSTNVQWIDPYRDIPRDGFGFYVYPTPYTVVNVAASHKLNESVKLTAAVNNLLDKRYEPAHGFEAPGIEALAGVTFSF